MKIGKVSNPTADFCTDRDKHSKMYQIQCVWNTWSIQLKKFFFTRLCFQQMEQTQT